MNAAQTIEAVLKNALINWHPIVVLVDQVSCWLLTESLAEVMYSSLVLFINSLQVICLQIDLS